MNTIQMAAQLYEIRDLARAVMGKNYSARMAEIGRCLKIMAAKQGCSELAAAQRLAADNATSGFEAMVTLAAAVELIEPSANTNSTP